MKKDNLQKMPNRYDEDKDYCTVVTDGKSKKACFYHDESYAKIKKLRKQADLRFLDSMIRLGVWKWKAKWRYWGVRIFGRLVI